MFVYFIQAANGGPIKIGKADRPDRRLKQLQAAHPYPLVILAVCRGGFLAEREVIHRFAHKRLQGEWFEPDDKLLALIADLPTWEAVEAGAECPEIVNSNIKVIAALYDAGYTFADLAELIGCSRQRAHQILQNERPGIHTRKRKFVKGEFVAPPPRPPRPEEPVADAYNRMLSELAGDTPLIVSE